MPKTIRQQLAGDQPWVCWAKVLAAFCAMHYLSHAPQSLREVFITGGIPPLNCHTDAIYRATYPVWLQRTACITSVTQRMWRACAASWTTAQPRCGAPGGGRLTARRFLQLGLGLGMSDGWETLHYLLEEAFVHNAQGVEVMNWNFLHHVNSTRALTQPALRGAARGLLHPGQCQCLVRAPVVGRVSGVWPGWNRPCAFHGRDGLPLDVRRLCPAAPRFKECAELLAHKADWPQLYDAQRLRANTVPAAAAVYYDDMYVHREFSEKLPG